MNYTSNNMATSDNGSNCVAPTGCSNIPYCSYVQVETSSGSNFDASEIDQTDCDTDPGNGKRYLWTLESSSVDAIQNPSSNTEYDRDWIPVNTQNAYSTDLNVSQNSNCVRVDDFSNLQVTTLSNDDYLCKCDSNNEDHYHQNRYFRESIYSDNDNKGYSNLEELRANTCSNNECRSNDYYTAKVKKVQCTGEEHIAISTVTGGLDCYNQDACSNLCLVSGLNFGNGIYDRNSDPATCFQHGTNDSTYERYVYTSADSYQADGTLTLMESKGTCSDNIPDSCSSDPNDSCGSQYATSSEILWGAREYISETTNTARDYTDNTVYTGTTVMRFPGSNVSITGNTILSLIHI